MLLGKEIPLSLSLIFIWSSILIIKITLNIAYKVTKSIFPAVLITRVTLTINF